eukprot:3586711-Rhodomonas_salina.1
MGRGRERGRETRERGSETGEWCGQAKAAAYAAKMAAKAAKVPLPLSPLSPPFTTTLSPLSPPFDPPWNSPVSSLHLLSSTPHRDTFFFSSVYPSFNPSSSIHHPCLPLGPLSILSFNPPPPISSAPLLPPPCSRLCEIGGRHAGRGVKQALRERERALVGQEAEEAAKKKDQPP